MKVARHKQGADRTLPAGWLMSKEKKKLHHAEMGIPSLALPKLGANDRPTAVIWAGVLM